MTSVSQELGRYLRMSQDRAREGHLPLVRQVVEMLYLLAFCSVGPGYYHRAKMYRRNMPFSSKRRYRLGGRYKALVDRYNPHPYRKISQNKLVEKSLLSTFRIPTAKLYGVYHPDSGYSTDGKTLRHASDLENLVVRQKFRSLAVKYVEGFEGHGFDILDCEAEDRGSWYSRALSRHVQPSEYLTERFALSENCGLIMEEVIIQHPAVAALNGSSVNTMRMWVTQFEGEVRVRSAMLKIGAGGSLVDYTSHGGAAVPVDITSGRLGRPRLRGGNAGLDSAPQPHISPDMQIPFFDEACDLARRALNLFPEIYFAGIDVAVTADGPLIVEMNVVPDPIHAAAIETPILDLLEPLPARRDR